MPAQITSTMQTPFAAEELNTAGQPGQGYQPAANPHGAMSAPLSKQENNPKGSISCFPVPTPRRV